MAGRCWSEDKEKRVFLTDNLYVAEYYGIKAMQKFGGNPLVLVVNTEGLGNFLKGGSERFDRDNLAIFDYYTQFWSEESVAPERIVEWLILPKNQSMYWIFTEIRNHYSKISMENN